MPFRQQFLWILTLGAAFLQGATLPVPAPAMDVSAGGSGTQTAVLAGGCFWGVDAVFRHVEGVTKVVSGYAGGSAATAHYDTVGSGTTGHAESVQVTFNPSLVSYGQLLRVFFSVAHNPTELNRQGPDDGPQYRSVIFFADEEQKKVAEAYVAQLNQAKSFRKRIATQIVRLQAFYPAEEYHQNFLALNPNHPYIVINDLPKIHQLKKQFPELYTGK